MKRSPLKLSSLLVPWLALLGVSCTAMPTSERIRNELGVALDYHEGKPPTLVFLHGWACERSHWSEQVPVFSRDHAVVNMDLAGHGETTVQKERWTPIALADEVVSVVEILDLDRVILVGHSMGASVALAAAARLPGRVLGVVGVDALHNAEFEFPEGQIEAMAALYRDDFGGAMQGFASAMFNGRVNEAELKEKMISGTERIRPEVAIDLFEAYPEMDFRELLHAAAVPIRCINASQRKTEIEINRKYADFNAVTLDGVSHFLMFESPQDFNQLLAATIAELAGR